MRRFLILFPVYLLSGFTVLKASFAQSVLSVMTGALVTVCARLIRAFGGQAIAEGAILRTPDNSFALMVVAGCNAAHVTVLLWAAVLSFPATWPQRAKGLAGGGAAIHAVNLIRIISLFYLGRWNRDVFDFAHVYLWESLITIDALVVFWTWVWLIRKPGPILHAHAA